MRAIVLAGGRGSRLAPFAAPKALMPISGVTILQRLLVHLLRSADSVIDHVVVCTGYRSKDVEASVRSHGWTPAQVTFSFAGEDAAMGARLLKVHDELKIEEQVIICYGDELVDLDIATLLRAHATPPMQMTFAAVWTPVPGGAVQKYGSLVAIVEGQRMLTNIGFVVVEPICWESLAESDGLSDWINRISARYGMVGVYEHDGNRATVNTMADVTGAEAVWK